MDKVSGEKILEQLKWRYAVKKFDPERKISDADWKILEESLVLTPTSYGLQPYKFIIITDDKLKAELEPFAWYQKQITTCSHLVVMANKKDLTEADIERYIERIMEVRGTGYNNDMKNFEATMKDFRLRAKDEGWIEIWSHKQTYLALGFLMHTAALLGIDSCPMEGFMPEEFDRVLELEKDGYTTAVLCPVGYRAEDDWLASLAKVRFPPDELIEKV